MEFLVGRLAADFHSATPARKTFPRSRSKATELDRYQTVLSVSDHHSMIRRDASEQAGLAEAMPKGPGDVSRSFLPATAIRGVRASHQR